MSIISIILEIILVKIDIEILIFYLKRMTKQKANLPVQFIGNTIYMLVAILGGHFFNNILFDTFLKFLY